MSHSTWTYCKQCMGQHDHQYESGRGWICSNCKRISTTLRHDPEKREQIKAILEARRKKELQYG